MKCLFLVRRNVFEFRIAFGFGETRAGFGGRPGRRMVQGEMPRPRGSPLKTREYDAAVVDRIVPLHGLDRLENVGFTGESIGVVAATEYVKRDFVLVIFTFRCGFAVEFREEAALR